MQNKLLRYTTLLVFLCVYFSVSASVHLGVQDNEKKYSVIQGFEENRGQIVDIDGDLRSDILFRSQGNGTDIYLFNDRIAYQYLKRVYPEIYSREGVDALSIDSIKKYRELEKQIETHIHRVDMVLIGANPNPEIVKEGVLREYKNYYQEHCPDGIHKVRSYQKITYKNIYKNIDWVIVKHVNHPSGNSIKYEFIVHPGGDPNDIKFEYKYADAVSLDNASGTIVVKNCIGELQENKPISFQNGIEIETNYRLKNRVFGYSISNYDRTQKLIIDPLAIAWGSFYNLTGGTGSSYNREMIIDKKDAIYICGDTKSIPNLINGGYQKVYGGGNLDGFLAKYNEDGDVLWSTYYGGSLDDYFQSCVVDTSDNLYLAGTANSINAISFNGFQNSRSGDGDAILVKFNPNGARIWGTYYGGTRDDAGYAVTIDNENNVYLTGNTYSSGIASMGYQNTQKGNSDAFLVKFNSSGNRLWATYYGGRYEDVAYGCAVNSSNDVYIAGRTNSDSFIASSGAYQDTIRSAGLRHDAFLTKFNKDGSRLWATYYGGSNQELFSKCAVDNVDNIYLYGNTWSGDLVTFNSFQNSYSGSYIVQFNNNGTANWSTYVGGNSDNNMRSCRVDKNGDAYFVGRTNAATGINYNPPYHAVPNIYGAGFILKMNSSGSRIWSTYFGGGVNDYLWDCGFDSKNNLHLYGFGRMKSTIRFRDFKYFDSTEIWGRLVVKFKECNHNNDTIKKSICTIDSFFFKGAYLKTSGTYYDTLKNAEGCDSFLTLHLDVSNYRKDSISIRRCSGSYLGYSSTGIYRDTFYIAPSCDSIRILNLVIKDKDTLEYHDTICSNQTYIFNGQNLNQSGMYEDTFISSQGCDSFVFLHLFVKNASFTALVDSTPCSDNPSYTFDGIPRTSTGTYIANYKNAVGCDSIVNLNLKIKRHSSFTLPPTSICPNTSYTFNGQVLRTSGTYNDTIPNRQGCDSVITLDLTVLNNPIKTIHPIQACAPYTFRGKVYTSSDTIIDTIRTTIGSCDSLYVENQLDLSPLPTQLSDTNYIHCDSFIFNGVIYNTTFGLIDTQKISQAPYCDSTYQNITHTIIYTPNIGLEKDYSYLRGTQITLSPFTANNYLWSTGETTRDISIKLEEDQNLYLIAWNHELCKDTAYVKLRALDLAILDFPTGFAPNGQHEANRTFKPNINGEVQTLHYMIFNRLGEKVYESADVNPIGWNGFYNGEPAPEGTYSYYCRYTTLGRNYTKSGEVLLVW